MSATLAFRLCAPAPPLAPRRGVLALTRAPDADGATARIELATPAAIVATSRGVVPHLSRDHVRRAPAVQWLHVPFESFLQIDPPAPTLQRGAHPLHTFLGFSPAQHIVSLALRDPADTRAMPPNGRLFVTAQSARGARKVTCPAYAAHVAALQPDIVFALSDVPCTPPPHSQKRTAKSVERSAQWLAALLAPPRGPPVFVPLAGGTRPAARAAFAAALLAPLEPAERARLALATLDDGAAGYVLDLAPLHADPAAPPPAALARASLAALPARKPRLATAPRGPHAVLALVRDAGVDLFDAGWAPRAAACGVALDFCFPAPAPARGAAVGHNLYAARYAHDFAPFAAAGAACACAACAPAPAAPLAHSAADARDEPPAARAAGHSRAYVHHLLHTHEMSAHALLALHNLAAVDAFMAGVRAVLAAEAADAAPGRFAAEVARFDAAYDGELRVLDEARACWAAVDQARGKGRLARERARQAEAAAAAAAAAEAGAGAEAAATPETAAGADDGAA